MMLKDVTLFRIQAVKLNACIPVKGNVNIPTSMKQPRTIEANIRKMVTIAATSSSMLMVGVPVRVRVPVVLVLVVLVELPLL